MAERIVQDDNCYCCGKQNSRGLHLEYRYPTKGEAQTECTIPDYFTGWKRITHGGFLAMLLDETMAHACISQGVNGVTVDIQVRYLKPVETGERIRISGRIVQVKPRIIQTGAEVIDEAGDVVARASARFMQIQGS